MNGTYHPALLFASYCVASCASYAALRLSGRIAALDGEPARYWLFGGALVTGTGLWTMHIVGMQALQLPTPLTYDLGFTALSWLSACCVSLLALHLISRSKLGPASLAGGALLMGAGFCLTLHSGLWAMRMTPAIGYDLGLLAAAAVSAVLASAAMLFICSSARQRPDAGALRARIASALTVGAALCAMHYTGVAAARFAPGALCAAGNLLGGGWMGLPLALVGIYLLGAALLLSRMDAVAALQRRRIEKRRFEIERVRRVSYYDDVTGLPNRSQFNQALLQQLIAVKGNLPPPFGLVYIELRSYRALLQQLGQDRVNRLLQSLAGQVSENLREGDMLARLARDGFICLLRQHDDRSISAATAQLSENLAKPLQSDGHSIALVWGIGASRYPDNGTSTQALIRAAMKLQLEMGGERKPARQQIISAFGAA
jgi:diguanylate cyclase